MSIDTPAKIIVFGAGPIGLEAAIYARFLGYDVEVYERGCVAENVLRWGHAQMLTPFGQVCSTLGKAAIVAQNPQYKSPEDVEILTGRQWVDRYLKPLSQTDLLADHIHCGVEVISVANECGLKHDPTGDDARFEGTFLVLIREHGRERVVEGDIVIDATGVFGNANHCGRAGLPAIGELSLKSHIEFGLPDALGDQRQKYAKARTLVIGGGHSAASTVTALAELAEQYSTPIIWTTRTPPSPRGPMHVIPDDPIPRRRELCETANRLAKDHPLVQWRPNTEVHSISQIDSQSFEIQLVGEGNETFVVDRVVANVGYRPDCSIHEELRVALSDRDDSCRELASCLNVQGGSPGEAVLQSLIQPEPNFYLLGAKSYGRRNDFFMTTGYDQIRALFSLIGDREELDLYSSAASLVK